MSHNNHFSSSLASKFGDTFNTVLNTDILVITVLDYVQGFSDSMTNKVADETALLTANGPKLNEISKWAVLRRR